MTDPNSHVAQQRFSTLQLTGLLLCWGILWTIQSPYDGMVHDAQLYALQALATLQPDVFGGDLFLRFGSQNDFTVFPRVYAPAVAAFGVERSAAALTLVFSIAWLAAGWRIARTLFGRDQAVVALGLLVAVKAWYGAYHVFRAGESFLSGRLPAEVLGLFAVAAYLSGRRLSALLLVGMAGAVHPLMTLPVALCLAFMFIHERWGGRGLLLVFPLLLIGGASGTLMFSGEFTPDRAAWLDAMRTRNIFLFADQWRVQDWQHHVLVLATLGLAQLATSSVLVRRYAVSTMTLGAAGACLAVIAGSLAEHFALLMAQPYRWFWLAVVSSILVLPATLGTLWNDDESPAGRSCAILLAAAWLNMENIGGFLALAALLLRCLPLGTFSEPVARSLRTGAWMVLAASAFVVALLMWQTANYPLDTGFEPVWVQRMVNGLPTNPTTLAAVLCCWLAIGALGRNRRFTTLLVLLLATLLVLLLPRAHRTWTKERFSAESRQALSGWRAILPREADVLWAQNPTGVWIMLERRSYMSAEQMAGLLYSPKMLPEALRRATGLQSYVAPGWWTLKTPSAEYGPKPLTPELLAEVCRAPGLDFVVSGVALDGYVASAMLPVDRVVMYLYDCRKIPAAGA